MWEELGVAAEVTDPAEAFADYFPDEYDEPPRNAGPSQTDGEKSMTPTAPLGCDACRGLHRRHTCGKKKWQRTSSGDDFAAPSQVQSLPGALPDGVDDGIRASDIEDDMYTPPDTEEADPPEATPPPAHWAVRRRCGMFTWPCPWSRSSNSCVCCTCPSLLHERM